MIATASTPPLSVLVLCVLIGLTGLRHVANELGRRIGLSRRARVLFGAGWGSGVLALGIKVVILSVLAQTDGRAPATTGMAARAAVEELFPAPIRPRRPRNPPPVRPA